MENIYLNDPINFGIVRDNSDLHELINSYLNQRLIADLDINVTDNEPKLEGFQVQPRLSEKYREYLQFKEYTDLKLFSFYFKINKKVKIKKFNPLKSIFGPYKKNFRPPTKCDC